MRFIHVWAYCCANYLMHQLKESNEKRRVYYYGFQIVIGGLVKAVLMVSIALLFRSLVPTLVILAIFGSLRAFAGGFHMDTYGKCIATSTLLFVVGGIAAQYTYRYWSLYNLAVLVGISLLLGIYISLKWAPKDNPNKPITKPNKIRRFKRLSIIYTIIWAMVNFIILYYKAAFNDVIFLNMFIISGSVGLVLELFTVTPAGYGFFEYISKKK